MCQSIYTPENVHASLHQRSMRLSPASSSRVVHTLAGRPVASVYGEQRILEGGIMEGWYQFL